MISGAWPPPAGPADRCQYLTDGRRPGWTLRPRKDHFMDSRDGRLPIAYRRRSSWAASCFVSGTDHRKSVVFVTHDIEEAIGLSDRILVMTDRPGRIKSEYRVETSPARSSRCPENAGIPSIE
jgi:hypothetical protein